MKVGCIEIINKIVEHGYNDFSLSDALAIASDTPWYRSVLHKERVFLPHLQH
jgi:hypothetical protein